MKKRLVLIGLILILLAGCGGTNDQVTITAEPDAYTPTMSSVQGITLTPEFKGESSDNEVVYSWKTSAGEFIGGDREIQNQGEGVIWSAIENDEVAEITKDVEINLEVIDDETDNVLASSKVTITLKDEFYKIKE